MKRTSFAAVFALLLASAFFCLGSKPLAAEPRALSGSEHLAQADVHLNASYKQIKKLYASDAQFLEKLKNSQRAWLKFRGAELDALFPHAKEDPSYYGSIYNEARAEWAAVLEDERTTQLDKWVKAATKCKDNFYLSAFMNPQQKTFGTAKKAYTLEEFAEANETVLNGNYQRIAKDKAYAADKLFIKKLRNAQRAWLKFRDAETETLVPRGKNDRARLYAGAQLTEDRSRQLLKWITGVNEGDVYAGSIKFK